MTRQTAYEILTKHLKNQMLLRHSLATEATMKALALRLNGDVDEWGVTGLLHDADYEKAKGHPEEHGLLLFKLEPNSIPTRIEHAIKAHNYAFTKVMPESLMDWAIICCDELTGIVAELAIKQPEKQLASLTPKHIMQKLNEKNLFKNEKKNILLCEEKLGIPLQEFVTITLTAMQKIAPDLGL